MKNKLIALLVCVISLALAIHYAIRNFLLNEAFIYFCLAISVISGFIFIILWVRNKS